eukprot:5506424-Amphidinium_carterae.1
MWSVPNGAPFSRSESTMSAHDIIILALSLLTWLCIDNIKAAVHWLQQRSIPIPRVIVINALSLAFVTIMS